MALGDRQEEILRLIEESERQQLTLSEIAKQTGRDKSNVSDSLQSLHRDGYVDRKEEGGRSKPYTLTALGSKYAASQRARNPGRRLAKKSVEPNQLCGLTEMVKAVKAASLLAVGQAFLTELGRKLETDAQDPDAVLRECRKRCEEGKRDHVIEAVGEVLRKLQPDRNEMRQWMTKHLASLIGVEGLNEVSHCSFADRVGYEIVIHADCMGVIECLVAIATRRPAQLKLKRFRLSDDEILSGFDSRHRIEMTALSLTGDQEAEELTDARAEQCFIGAYARRPEFAHISKSAIPERYLRTKVREPKVARYHVVFDAESEAALARRFHEALMSNEISVNIVLQGPASRTMSEIQAWLMEYFRWPLEEELS